MRFRIKGRRRSLRRCEKGTAAIEFALVAAPFFLMLVGIFEAGMMLLANYQMDDAVADIAREIRTGQAQEAGMSAAEFKAAVCQRAFLLRDCTSKLYVDVDTFPDFASLKFNPPLKKNDDGSYSLADDLGTKFNIGGAMNIIGVRVYYPWKFITAFFPDETGLADFDGTRLLSTAAAFRNEPFN